MLAQFIASRAKVIGIPKGRVLREIVERSGGHIESRATVSNILSGKTVTMPYRYIAGLAMALDADETTIRDCIRLSGGDPDPAV